MFYNLSININLEHARVYINVLHENEYLREIFSLISISSLLGVIVIFQIMASLQL